MAHIRVAGIGGLGLVAMAGVVAWNVPEIRVAMAIAVVAGARSPPHSSPGAAGRPDAPLNTSRRSVGA